MTDLRGGLFITLEGTDGSGKTTQMDRLIDAAANKRATMCRDTVNRAVPRSAAQIRRILLDSENSGL